MNPPAMTLDRGGQRAPSSVRSKIFVAVPFKNNFPLARWTRVPSVGAKRAERGVHAASTCGLNNAFGLNSTRLIFCAVKRHKCRAPAAAPPHRSGADAGPGGECDKMKPPAVTLNRLHQLEKAAEADVKALEKMLSKS
jgi:hypothetical protein